MILAVDIGNTSIGLCGIAVDPEKAYVIKFSCKIRSLPAKTKERYADEIKAQMEKSGLGWRAFDAAVISSVVPGLTNTIKECVWNLFGIDAYVITSESDTGLQFRVEHPEKIGKDRLADAAWAAANFPLPVVTVDMGTATTFNVIDEDACFLGGIICAGVNTGLSALMTHTAQLPKVAAEMPGRMIGKTTDECMRSGAVIGTAAMIDGITERIESELGRSVSLVMTGGMGKIVSSFCKHPHTYDPFLLYKGMVKIYERSVSGKDSPSI